MEVINIEQYFNLEKTVESGQLFRFEKMGAYDYIVSATNSKCRIIQQKPTQVTIEIIDTGYENQKSIKDWEEYFSLHDDYTVLEYIMCDVNIHNNDYLRRCYRSGNGLRVLKQDPWEALVCFIISQRNSIPRISKTVKKICSYTSNGKFPNPDELRDILNNHHDELSLGYRWEYLYELTKTTGIVETLARIHKNRGVGYDRALSTLLRIKGVGPKVANCVLLFSLGYTQAFPVDTWIQKQIDKEFNGQIDISKFGQCAGIVQQYMFYHARYKGGE